MRAYIGITDWEWFQHLRSMPQVDEINFWKPGGKHRFGAVQPGELFLFKLHSPRNYVVGGGLFSYSTILPVSLAWESFKEANGAPTFEEMRRRIAANRVSLEFRRAHPEIDWRGIIGLWNYLMHAYDRVDRPTVWRAAREDVPALGEWVSAVNAHGGFGRWASGVSRSPSDVAGILASIAAA